MSTRYATKISKEDLKNKISKYRDAEDNYAWPLNIPKVAKDISKVEFDFENVDDDETDVIFGPKGLAGLSSLNNGLIFWGVCAGGDWEQPVFFYNLLGR